MGTVTIRRMSRSFRLTALIIASLFAIGMAGGVLAQDETPEAGAAVTHPAHIHVGTCAELDPNPLAPLNNVGPQTTDDDELPEAEDIRGSLSPAGRDLRDGGCRGQFRRHSGAAHAINVHESDQNPQNYIACGDIGGPVIDDKLTIGLRTK